jgi:hypothetical protein
MIRMRKIALCIIPLLFISFSCNSVKNKEIETNSSTLVRNISQNDLTDIIASKSKAIYLSYDTLNPDFGKIMLIDLISKKSVELFHNKYFNSNPIFFDNGSKVLFASAQVGDPLKLQITKHHAWRQLYLIDISSNAYSLYFSSGNNPDNLDISKFIGLSWDPRRKQVYFIDEDNLYAIEDYKYLPKLLQTFDHDLMILGMKLSPDNQYLSIPYRSLRSLNTGTIIYDIALNRVVNDFKPKKINFRFLGWTFNNNIFYQEDSLFIYELNSKSINRIDANLNYDDFYIREAFAENSNSFILLIDKLVEIDKAEYKVAICTELARFNIHSNEIEWITNDSCLKKELDVSAILDSKNIEN